MDSLFKIDWQGLFFPSVSLAELFLRGTLVYLLLFGLLRFMPNRQIGAVGITDLLVVILFANAAQNAMVSSYTSLTDGFFLVGTIVFWSYALNWLGYQFPRVQRLLSPPPLILVKNSRIIHRNMRKELITEGELMVQIRKQGVERLSDVRLAFMEADGNISVIPRSAKVNSQSEPSLE